MRAVVHEFHTEVFPTTEEAKEICKIGQGADCCILLLAGPEGFECCYHNRSPILDLIKRAERGETVAQRVGCDRLAAWAPKFSILGEVEIP